MSFLIGDIYRTLRAAGKPIPARAVAEKLGHPVKRVSGILGKMRRRGLTITYGWGPAARHCVAQGTRCPVNRKGKAKGSKRVLAVHSRERAEKSKALRLNKTPTPQTALERCWGWMPANLSTLQGAENGDPIVGGIVRPQET